MQPNTRSTPNLGDQKSGTSGRRFIVLFTITVLIFWASLWVSFRFWKSGYDQKAQVGRETARHIRKLVEARPDGVSASVWEDTVDHAEAMLIAVTGSNLLNIQQIQALTVEIDERVAAATRQPNQGPAILKELWDELAKRAGPVANIYGRPKLVEAANGK
jgi:hypothetical protein